MFIARGRISRNLPPWMGLLAALLLAVTSSERHAAAQQAPEADNVVMDIQSSGTADDLEIVIVTAKRPDASVFALSSPARIVIDIAETSVGNFVNPIAVDIGAVKDITTREFRDAEGIISRITVGLDAVVDYTTSIEENAIRIRIRPRSEGAAEDTGGEELDLIGEEIARMEQGASGETEERVEEVVITGTPAVREAPLETSAPAPVAIPDDTGLNEILGLDFLPYEKYSQVRITAERPVSYKVHPVGKDNQLVVDLSGVELPPKFRRPLDTSEFPSNIKMISAYPLRGRPGMVRLVVKLREQQEPRVEERGNIVYFEFPVPESIAAGIPQPPPTMESAGVAHVPDQGAELPTGGAEVPTGPTRISASGEVIQGDLGQSMAAQGALAVSSTDSLAGTKYVGRKISIDVREADLHNIFRMISNVSKLNIVAGDNVKGKVTVRLTDVPWDQALDVILRSKNLGYERNGNIVRIAPLKDLKAEREARLKAEKSQQQLEPLHVDIIPLSYAVADDIRDQIEGALTERGKLTLDTRTNSLVVEDTRAALTKIRALAASLDTPTPQVLIEARIVEVNTTFLRNFGIQWGGDVNAGPNSGVNTGLYFPNGIYGSGGLSDAGSPIRANSGQPNWVVDLPSANVAGALSLHLGSISNIVNVDVRLSALERFGQGKVISSPKVITVDNSTAKISQGTRIPYETVSAAGTSVQFIEATLELTVTPHITQDNRVFLKVEVSNNRPDFAQQVNGNPAIEVKEATTEVMVKDGDTTVLGGVYTLNETKSVTGLPGLQKIPFLGWLFKNKLETSERKELLVFITPHVVVAPSSSS